MMHFMQLVRLLKKVSLLVVVWHWFAHPAIKNLKGENEDETIGVQIVKKALEAPLRTIADNAGVEGSVVLQRVMNSKGSTGYNARTDKFEDLKKAGVIDPTKVTRIALENAASIAGMVLTTECVSVTSLKKMVAEQLCLAECPEACLV
jgi:chaperonin GroEL (HSP60 family)